MGLTCYLVLIDWALQGLTGPYWALLGLTGSYRALLALTGPTGPY